MKTLTLLKIDRIIRNIRRMGNVQRTRKGDVLVKFKKDTFKLGHGLVKPCALMDLLGSAE